MKKIFLFLAALTFGLSAAAQQKTYTISGTLTVDSLRFAKKAIEKVYLKRTIDGQETIVDSAIVKNKKFKFKGEAPEFVELASIGGFDNGSIYFLLEGGNITIAPFNGQFPVGAVVGGTKNNDAFTGYMMLVPKNGRDSRVRMDALLKSLPADIAQDDKKFYPYQYSAYHSNSVYYKVDIIDYMLKHIDCEASLFMLRQGLFQMFAPKVVERQFLRAVPLHLRNHPVYLEMVNQIKADNLKEGAFAPDITGKTVDGKSISLSSLKGKYVLLDFWASWCAPCRKEFPFMREVLAASEGRDDFVILSYSIDSKRNDWVNCIEKNQLTHENWLHISTLKGWQSDAVKLFSVKGVPHTVLLNPEGQVVAFNLRGEAMVQKIKNILSGKESYK